MSRGRAECNIAGSIGNIGQRSPGGHRAVSERSIQSTRYSKHALFKAQTEGFALLDDSRCAAIVWPEAATVVDLDPEEKMLVLQAVPQPGRDIFKLLRSRIRAANTWDWSNKTRTRIKHKARPKGGYIKISNAGGVLVAHVHPKEPADLFYLAEKFTGRLVAWFQQDLAAINVQFIEDPPARKPKKRR